MMLENSATDTSIAVNETITIFLKLCTWLAQRPAENGKFHRLGGNNLNKSKPKFFKLTPHPQPDLVRH